MKYQDRIEDEGRLTTEDLARSPEADEEESRSTAQGGADRQDGRPVYPGEATGGDLRSPEGEEPPAEDEAATADTDDRADRGDRGDRADERAGADGAGRTDAADRTERTDPADRTDEAAERAPAADGEQPLLSENDEDELRTRWQQIQNDFVDDPREAVHAADLLVADLMQRLATSFADHKRGLEDQWNRGDEVQTEDLRLALQQYRSFFNRLLSS
ncbi:hypothetical protein ACFC1R_29845 [Kitasatospora sp. NPDC056138]|uniref:hypothetical protein n=1 Tax=Kitasatospora sp. NPDC056138 TaxID=3345724 RepID=UPI0035E27D80